ncbi:uncharacterized protein LOC120256634 [Dioscorea cayenensis subsp. rotundata]|uniref:Uncharacterized protein LOC120256634 n=1 Tax=Dioscorea cayennensis subsp. rotundata TaxID=55577 RepID=A0AB40AZK1_DIOCR|nr:uncharacterized protein LOC120256634 [Dioscorea cayenensis subsp. rotundata]
MASSPPTELKEKPNSNEDKKRRRPPSAEEMLAHYEAQGLDTREASLKAIKELQLLLYRSVSSARPGAKKDDDSTRKLDNVYTRLAILDMKLDSKPNFPQSLAIGVTAQAIFTGLSTIYKVVRSATRGSPPPSS